MIQQNLPFMPVKPTGTTPSYCLSTVAKMLQLSPRKFIQWLATNHYIFKRQSQSAWEAYQSHINSNLLIHRMVRIEHTSGDVSFEMQVRVTNKGVNHFTQVLA